VWGERLILSMPWMCSSVCLLWGSHEFPLLFLGMVQEALCDLLDVEGKESLELAVCNEASGKSPRAFWAFRRLGYLQVNCMSSYLNDYYLK
jgi:hypothetical protein